MSNFLLDQHCINCELFISESETHKNIGIHAGNYGSNGFNVTVMDAIFCIYGFSARDLAFAHLNLNFETDENILQQKELSELTGYILQRGLPLCSKCVLSIKQVFINHVKLKKEASEFSLLSKVLKRNRSFEINQEVGCSEERGSNHEHIEQTGFELPAQGQSSFQEFEPLHEFEDFDLRSDAEDVKVDPLSCVKNEDQFSPDNDNLLSEMKPFSVVLPPINSGTVPNSQKRSRPRKQCRTISSTEKKGEEGLLKGKRQKTLRKEDSPSSENNGSNGNINVCEKGDNGDVSHIKSEAIQNLFEGEDEKPITEDSIEDRTYCQPCDRYFKTVVGLNQHQRKQHSGSKTGAGKEKHFKCGCGYSVYKIENLVVHEKHCKSPDPVICDICGQFFEKKYSLYAHKKKFHSQINPGYPKCDVCGTIFVWKAHLKRHIESVHPKYGKTFVSGKCGNSFTTLNCKRRPQIRTKVDESQNKELLRCKVCGIIMKNQAGLKHHTKMMHTENERHITCIHCGKTATNMTDMTTHICSHDPNRIPI